MTKPRSSIAVPWLGALGLFVLSGCGSVGLLQTAHTAPPATVRVAFGASEVSNELSKQVGRPAILSASAEIAGRLGLTNFLDVGIAPFFRSGAAVDLKANVIPNQKPFALAPRVRIGYADPQNTRLLMLEGGLVTSYHFFSSLEPYLGIAVANHWIRYPIPQSDLAPNQSIVSANGSGDAVLKGHVGIDINLSGGFGMIGEYGYWRALENDTGDGFKFLNNHVYAFAFRFHGGT